MQCETVAGGPTGNKLIIETAKKMYAQGAWRTSYRGLTMGLVGMFPYSAIDLGTFEFLKGRLVRYNAKVLGCHEEDAMPGSFATGCIGAFSVSICLTFHGNLTDGDRVLLVQLLSILLIFSAHAFKLKELFFIRPHTLASLMLLKRPSKQKVSEACLRALLQTFSRLYRQSPSPTWSTRIPRRLCISSK